MARSFTRFYLAPVLVMVAAYMLPLAAVSGAVRAGDPQVLRARQEVIERVAAVRPIATVGRDLREGRWARAMLVVFVWNFGVGALLMSAGIGVVFFLPPLVGIARGVLLGLLYDPAVLEGARGVVTVGTALLELPSYMIAGAIGIRLGLAWLRPPRRERLREVWAQARWSLAVVGLCLALGAVWEVGGLALLGPRP